MKTKKSVYDIITDKIISKLEEGVIPWRRPWKNGGSAVNWKTQKAYRGVNAFLLDPGEYATFNQIKEAGGKVKKGAKSEIVTFWKMLEVDNKETKDKETVPLLRYYRVFEINTQVEGLTSKKDTTTYEHDPIEEAEKIVQGYPSAPYFTFNSGRAYYQPDTDKINCPPLKDFPVKEEYYSTLFHEMVHSTGHKERLNRQGVAKNKITFGDQDYSKEELIAEMGATMLCGMAGIDQTTIDNSASYIKSWLSKLKKDNKLIIQASGQAQKAADLILDKEEAKKKAI